MKNAQSIALIACALLTTSVFSQETKTPPKEPKTQLEAFEVQTGSVLIKGFGEVGSIGGMSSSIVVECREFTDASTARKVHGITIEVKEGGRVERRDTAFVDYDEIDSLLKGIDYISKLDKSVTTLPNFEAVYKTKGDLRIFTFSSSNSGKIQAAVQAARFGSGSAFISLDQLAKLRTLIADAKAKLDAIKKT